MKSFARTSISLCAGALALAFAAAESSAFAATPIAGCSVLSAPGSYVLANDIINPALPSTGGFCILASVDRVTLDLGGHTISSSSSTASAIGGEHSFVVRNGTIKGFKFAVAAGPNATVENLVIDSVAATGINVVDGRVEGNTIVNTPDGIVTDRPSIIARNFMKDDNSDGIQYSAVSVIRDNVIVSSGRGIDGGSAADAEIGLIADNVVRAPVVSIFQNPCHGGLITANMLTQFPALANNDGSCVPVGNALQQ
jgi:hypothetical protein